MPDELKLEAGAETTRHSRQSVSVQRDLKLLPDKLLFLKDELENRNKVLDGTLLFVIAVENTLADMSNEIKQYEEEIEAAIKKKHEMMTKLKIEFRHDALHRDRIMKIREDLTKLNKVKVQQAVDVISFIDSLFEPGDSVNSNFELCERGPKMLAKMWKNVGGVDECSFQGGNKTKEVISELMINEYDYERNISNRKVKTRIGTGIDSIKNFGFSTNLKEGYQYEFDEEDSPLNITSTFSDNEEQIKSATISKLVARLTDPKFNASKTRNVFLLTHKTFTTSLEMLDMLERRYYVPIPPNMTPAEIKYFKEHNLARIQIKIFSVLKNWLEKFWEADFQPYKKLKDRIGAMLVAIEKESVGGNPITLKSAILVKKIVQRKTLGVDSLTSDAEMKVNAAPSGGNFSNADFITPGNEEEIAKQWSLRDFQIFKSIKPREFISCAWSGKQKEKLAPGILAFIDVYNQTNNWIQRTIVSYKGDEQLKMRATLYTKFVRIADALIKLQNFSSAHAIHCALSANPIYRMKKTRAEVEKLRKTVQDFEKIDKLFKAEKNKRALRQRLKNAFAPCIPYIGLFLADLTFIEDGNADIIDNHKINFLKRRFVAMQIHVLKNWQAKGHDFKWNGAMQQYFSECLSMPQESEEDLWKKSLQAEPREKKKKTG